MSGAETVKSRMTLPDDARTGAIATTGAVARLVAAGRLLGAARSSVIAMLPATVSQRDARRIRPARAA